MQMLSDFANTPHVLGIGSDILDAKRIEKVYARHNMRFVKRILTANEISLWQARGSSTNFLAKQFAAKEAIVKALGVGFTQGVSFEQLEVLRTEQGAPIASVSGKAQQLMHELEANTLHVSLSDEGSLVLAFALISR